jgi:hypothetical protein
LTPAGRARTGRRIHPEAAMAIPAHGPAALGSVPGARPRVRWEERDVQSGKPSPSRRPGGRGQGELEHACGPPVAASDRNTMHHVITVDGTIRVQLRKCPRLQDPLSARASVGMEQAPSQAPGRRE